ncbi:hypothetical protein AHV09_25385 [Salmonella enterica subsp. enterica]|nr:hypothetical protein [Salmonella enterica subsp. enterica serovar Gombe]
MKDRYVFLTVPRALSRIHRTTKFALKRAAAQQGRLIPPKLHTAMSRSWSQPEAHYRSGFNAGLVRNGSA